MAVGTYYFDTATFANATTVYTDVALTLVAPNGFYSDDTIVREQINGQLQVAETCDCSGMPVSPTIYTVTQNVTNGIVGILGTGYTLSGIGYDGGNPPGPLTQSGAALDLYSFIIDATPASGYQFSSSAPFSATNPNGQIPSQDLAVTNTLEGTIELIPPPVVASFYYKITPCAPCDPNEARYIGPLTVGPGDQQQYLDPNSGCYYKYIPSFLNPPAAFVPGNLIINAEPIPNTFGCPVLPTLRYYIVTDCNTNIEYSMETAETYPLYTRISHDQDLYTISGVTTEEGRAGLPTIPTSPCVDDQNRLPGDPNFSGCTINCEGQTYLVLEECSQGVGDLVESLNLADLWFGNGFAINDYVYVPQTEKCYQIISTITRTSVTNSTTINLADMNKVDSCSQCSPAP